jgi:DNA invertase Pin-like site-specific DNA recombinase
MPFDLMRLIAYLRVSTERQRRSGLGLEARRATIERFTAGEFPAQDRWIILRQKAGHA